MPAALSTALLVVALLVGCTDDGGSARRSRSSGGATSTTADVARITAGPRMGAWAAGRWIDLPASPLGDRHGSSWVFLEDGSGIVQAGASEPRGSAIDITRRSAYFSFADRRWFTLPDLPVKSGVGAVPGGARIGDTLVLAGQDCPSTTTISMIGSSYCDTSAAGSRVLITLDLRRGDHWVRHEVPRWMRGGKWVGLQVRGIRDGHLLVSSTDATSTRLAEFEPRGERWFDRGRVPDPPPGFSGWLSNVCPAGGRVVVAMQSLVGVGAPAQHTVRLTSTTDGRRWDEWRAPLPDRPDEMLGGPRCTAAGVYLTRATGLGPEDNELLLFDPATGSTRVVLDRSTPIDPSTPGSGAVILLAPPFSTDPAVDSRRRLVTPDGVREVDLGTEQNWGPRLVGSYLVDFGTRNAAGSLEYDDSHPRVLPITG